MDSNLLQLTLLLKKSYLFSVIHVSCRIHSCSTIHFAMETDKTTLTHLYDRLTIFGSYASLIFQFLSLY